MGLRLFFLPIFPHATFIQGATFIPDSRVGSLYSRVSTILEILEFLKGESISLRFWLKIHGKLVSDLL